MCIPSRRWRWTADSDLVETYRKRRTLATMRSKISTMITASIRIAAGVSISSSSVTVSVSVTSSQPWKRSKDHMFKVCEKLTPSTPGVPNCCCSKGSAPYWSNPPLLIFGIRALWRSGLSDRAPECQKLKMLSQTSMAKCKALTGSALKGLSLTQKLAAFRNVSYNRAVAEQNSYV